MIKIKRTKYPHGGKLYKGKFYSRIESSIAGCYGAACYDFMNDRIEWVKEDTENLRHQRRGDYFTVSKSKSKFSDPQEKIKMTVYELDGFHKLFSFELPLRNWEGLNSGESMIIENGIIYGLECAFDTTNNKVIEETTYELWPYQYLFCSENYVISREERISRTNNKPEFTWVERGYDKVVAADKDLVIAVKKDKKEIFNHKIYILNHLGELLNCFELPEGWAFRDDMNDFNYQNKILSGISLNVSRAPDVTVDRSFYTLNTSTLEFKSRPLEPSCDVRFYVGIDYYYVSQITRYDRTNLYKCKGLNTLLVYDQDLNLLESKKIAKRSTSFIGEHEGLLFMTEAFPNKKTHELLLLTVKPKAFKEDFRVTIEDHPKRLEAPQVSIKAKVKNLLDSEITLEVSSSRDFFQVIDKEITLAPGEEKLCEAIVHAVGSNDGLNVLKLYFKHGKDVTAVDVNVILYWML